MTSSTTGRPARRAASFIEPIPDRPLARTIPTYRPDPARRRLSRRPAACRRPRSDRGRDGRSFVDRRLVVAVVIPTGDHAEVRKHDPCALRNDPYGVGPEGRQRWSMPRPAISCSSLAARSTARKPSETARSPSRSAPRMSSRPRCSGEVRRRRSSLREASTMARWSWRERRLPSPREPTTRICARTVLWISLRCCPRPATLPSVSRRYDALGVV